ncbi:MAG TPA: hypothetical protein DDW42_01075 [Desulfobacteraceae bacterium]|nr:hypothetical protein [Desulfobacteraceae bacterium]
MKKIILPLLSFCFLTIFGCLPFMEKHIVAPSTPGVTAPPLVSADLVDKRIQFLEEILLKKELSEKDKKIASDLLQTYRLIGESSGYATEEEYREFIRNLFNALGVLDKNYFLKQKSTGKDDSRAISIFTAKKNEIMDAYLGGDFKGVINDCLDIKKDFGPDALTPEIGLVFSLSLARAGMKEEAINIGEGIVRELEPRPDLIYLNAMIAGWQLDLKHREKALQIYEKLTDNLDEKKDLLRGLNKKLAGKTRHEIESKATPITQRPLDIRMEEEVKGPIAELLQKIDSLILRHEYEQAKLVLIRNRIRGEKVTDIEIIDQALRRVEQAEKEFENKWASKDAQDKETLDIAKDLVENEKFEEAIKKLSELKTSRNLRAESEELENQAVDQLVNRERNKAAKLFLASRDTLDQAKKKQYLKSSYDILKGLIEKYPSSSLNTRLKSNIKKVSQELDKLQNSGQ